MAHGTAESTASAGLAAERAREDPFRAAPTLLDRRHPAIGAPVKNRLCLSAVVALALLASACGGSDSSSSATTTTSKAPVVKTPANLTVEVDGKAPDFHSGFLAYFPKAVQAHPGEEVTFHNNFSGEPHTVTFGTLADAAIAAAAKADPNAQTPPPEVAKLPELLPQGPGDANQTAAKGCVVDSGELPKDGAGCTGTDVAFTGKQAFYNSGYLPPTLDNWKLKLADDIAPGTYNYFCLLHGTQMSGSVTVVPKATTVPSPAAVAAQAAKERDAGLAKVKAAVAALPKGEVPGLIPAAPGQVLAGSGAEDPTAPGIEEFGPRNIKVPVGGSVTWLFIGPHSVSFNAPREAQNSLVKGDDGGWHINEKAAAPAGGPPVATNDGPPGPPKVTDGGSWDGTGFRNTGLVISFPPALSAYKLTFTKAGTYGYVCLIHPGMFGSVTVG
jgi:plastocyanin